jgi:Ca-activated chloride channel family protein
MEQLADRGDGFYSYVDTFGEAERLFVDELAPTLTVVARDAKIQVAFDPSVIESYRLIGYENRKVADEDFRNDDVDAGELGAGHSVTALYEVKLVDPDAADGNAGTVALRWESAETGKVAEKQTPITVGSRDAANTGGLALAATVASAAEVLRSNSAVTGRQITLDTVIADAKAIAVAEPGAAELVEYLETVASLKEAPNE